MDLERMKRRSELAETTARRRKLAIEAEALLTELRLATDPLLTDDLTEMDLDGALKLMTELHRLWAEARRLADRSERLKKALGEK